MPPSYPDSVRFLYAIGNELKSAKLGLERMREVLAALGSPERSLRFVHVAGTNGKGSVCAMIEAGLRAAGARTGLFTSPHLVSPTERIRVNGEPLSEDAFAAAFGRVHAIADPEAHPSYFESVTAMALLAFQDAEVDWVVWETGLGGRLDATNVVTPALTVITAIDYDHQEFLGSTIEQIAAEKGGILKPGVPLVLAHQEHEQARQVILETASARGVAVRETAEWQPVQDLTLDARGCRYFAGGSRVICPLAGEHQVENSLAAALALDTLGYPAEGIARTVWPGRLEVVHTAPEILLDGAHNPAGVRALVRYLERFYSGRRMSLVFAAMKDKDPGGMLAALAPLFTQVQVTAPDTPRAMDPEALKALSPHLRTGTLRDVAAAVAWAKQQPADDVVVFAGSLYLVGEARGLLVQ